jgi:hypothetical protein
MHCSSIRLGRYRLVSMAQRNKSDKSNGPVHTAFTAGRRSQTSRDVSAQSTEPTLENNRRTGLFSRGIFGFRPDRLSMSVSELLHARNHDSHHATYYLLQR